jgi:predicted ATP-grasp superfamily ATP-dependent carboligase
VRAGYQPITADLFADVDLRAIATTTRISPYPEGLVDWLRAVEPAAWMYTGALENHSELVDQMGWIAPLWGNPGEVLARVRSPWELDESLRGAGLLFPETRSSATGLPQDGSWLVKTYRGASGSGVWEWSQAGRRGDLETSKNPLSERPAQVPCVPDSSPGPVFQRRVRGTPSSAVFVAAGGAATLLGMTRQLVGESWLGAHRFQYAGSIGPWPVSERALATIARIGDAIAGDFGLVGLFGVDMILDGDNVWTLEVNPRYTASVEIVERVTGIHAIAVHAAACASGLGAGERGLTLKAAARPPAASRPYFYGKAILYAKRDLLVSARLAEMALAEAKRNPWPMLADVPSAGTAVDAGRPIITLFVEGVRLDDVEHRLHDRATELEQMIYPRGFEDK